MVISAALLAGSGMGYSVYQGEQARKQQKKALDLQKQEQAKAEARAISAQRRSEMEQAAINRKKPDVNALLKASQDAGKAGAASTMLTGPAGVNPDDMRVNARSTPTLLGT